MYSHGWIVPLESVHGTVTGMETLGTVIGGWWVTLSCARGRGVMCALVCSALCGCGFASPPLFRVGGCTPGCTISLWV